MEEFRCPITNCNYLSINSSISKSYLADYCKSADEKMKNGEIKNFIVHCSSFLYKNGEKFIDVFEMVECFDLDILHISDENVPQSLSFSNGMIFVFPNDDDIIWLLNKLFESPNARFITNNMDKTISLLNNRRIRFDLNNIIDIKTKFNMPMESQYFEILDSEMQSKINSYETDFFDKSRFLRNVYFSNDPLPIICSKSYFKKATYRCAAIGIVFLNKIKEIGINRMIEFSKEQLKSMSKLKRFGSWVPSVYASFCSIKSKKYIKEKSPYRILYITNLAIKNYKTYSNAVPKEKQLTRTIIQNAKNEILKKIASQNSLLFTVLDSYFINNEEIQKIIPDLQNYYSQMEKNGNKNNKIYKTIEQTMTTIQNYINSDKNQVDDEQKQIIDSNIPLCLSIINNYFSFISDKSLDQFCRSSEDKIFQSIFASSNNSVLLQTPDPLFNCQDTLLKTNHSVVQLNLPFNGINDLLLNILSIRTYKEKYQYPFLLYIVNEENKPKNSQYPDMIFNLKALTNMYNQYKSFKKQKVCILTPKEVLEFYKKMEKSKFNIFLITRFCFANINFNDDISNLLYGLLSIKINEMDEQKMNFPLQLLIISNQPDYNALSLFNKVYLFDLQEQNNENNLIQKQIEKLDKVKPTIISALSNVIKKMENNSKITGYIVIYSLDEYLHKEILEDIKTNKAFKNSIIVCYIGTQLEYNPKFKKHPNAIKIIITNKPPEISIKQLAAVIDVGFHFDSQYDQNDIKHIFVNQLSRDQLCSRRSIFRPMNPKFYYQINLKKDTDIQNKNIYDTVFNYLDLNFTKDELQKLSNQSNQILECFDNLIDFGIISKAEPHNLTSYGKYITTFKGINLLISKSILSAADYSPNDEISLRKNVNQTNANDKKILLGLLVYLLIKNGNVLTKGLQSKYSQYSDKRSDLLPLVRILCDYFQKEVKNQAIAASFGINFNQALPIYEYMDNFINCIFTFDKKNARKMNTKIMFGKLKDYVEHLANTNKLYDFIQKLLAEIHNNIPEFFNARYVSFSNFETGTGNLIFKGNDSQQICCDKWNGLFIPTQKTDSYLLHMSINSINNTVNGSILHTDQLSCLGSIYPWLEENKNKNITDEMIIDYAKMIAPNCVQFIRQSTCLIFTTKSSVLTPLNNVPFISDGDINDVIYAYASNYIENDILKNSLHYDFQGFTYGGANFPRIQFEKDTFSNCQIWKRGRGCFCLNVLGGKYEENLNKIQNILKKKNIKANVNIIPIYRAFVNHEKKIKLSKEQFIEKVKSVKDKFGGIIEDNDVKYKEADAKYKNMQHGTASFLLYSSYFTIPFAKMMRNTLYNKGKKEEQIEELVFPNDFVDEAILDDIQVFLALNSWFKTNKFQIIRKNNKYYGTKSAINDVLAKFETDPPMIPFNSFDIPETIIITDLREELNSCIKKAYYINKKNRKLFVPKTVKKSDIENIYKRIDIIIWSDDDDDDENYDEDKNYEDEDYNENENYDDDDDYDENENCEEDYSEDDSFSGKKVLKIPDTIIDGILLKDDQVINILNSWFKKNKFKVSRRNNEFMGMKSSIKEILKKLKSNPPKIPFNSYDIPKNYDLNEIRNQIDKNKKFKCYLNESKRKLFAPSYVDEKEIHRLINGDEQNENDNENGNEKDYEDDQIYEYDDEQDEKEKDSDHQKIIEYDDDDDDDDDFT